VFAKDRWIDCQVNIEKNALLYTVKGKKISHGFSLIDNCKKESYDDETVIKVTLTVGKILQFKFAKEKEADEFKEKIDSQKK